MFDTAKSQNKQYPLSNHEWRTKGVFLGPVRCGAVKTQTHNGGPVSAHRALKIISYYSIRRRRTTVRRGRKTKNEQASEEKKILLIPYSSLTHSNDDAHTHIPPVTHVLTQLTQPGVSGMQPEARGMLRQQCCLS